MSGKIRVGINGFGRIGRLTMRCAWDDDVMEIVHINEISSLESAVYLMQYDSVHGTWKHKIKPADDAKGFSVDGKSHISYSSEKDFNAVDWKGMGVELVLECSGKFKKKAKLQEYIEGGVKRVLVSAPVKEEGVTNVVLGCNEEILDAKYPIATNASCTTNCIGPVIKVMHKNFGIKHGCITTVHNVTATQTMVDMPNFAKNDLRRARSGMLNLCPTSTGSATAITNIFPELKGKLNGLAIRVPLLNASITDIVLELNAEVTAEQVNAVLEAASQGDLKGILGFERAPLVSSDYTNDTRSSIIDALSTMVIDGTMVKIYAWYDNEFGYSKRMAELASLICTRFLVQQN